MVYTLDDKSIRIIKLILIIFLIILNLFIYLVQKDMGCDKCKLIIKDEISTPGIEEKYITQEISINDLYEKYSKGICINNANGGLNDSG